ncbi:MULTISPECIES: hypothetical protein [unclassified Aureispira]|uniref:hypothetical protein n=1 Tax=unclassified Aureispira TaxID=2649989 RepID=UPI000697CA53|nr:MULTISPECIES: hypothetical protein [unclassified Aureispira]WMX14661.1 hypothetical protein QP953_27765 [Aureispira sp. CCB-E]
MTLKSTPILVLISVLLLFLSIPTYSQMCEGRSKTNITNNLTKKAAPLTSPTPSKKVKVHIPVNYKPPVANKHLITFPETTATKRKQKKLLKKRKRTKKKGCIAINM